MTDPLQVQRDARSWYEPQGKTGTIFLQNTLPARPGPAPYGVPYTASRLAPRRSMALQTAGWRWDGGSGSFHFPERDTMTLPRERTTAVIRAREFLLRLVSPHGGGLKRIPREVRQEARRLLRHYPGWYDLGRTDAFDSATASREGLESDAEWLRAISAK